MPSSSPNRASKRGMPPGTLVHVGKKRVDKVHISVLDYTNEKFEEHECDGVEDCFGHKESDSVSWINIDGLHDVEAISRIGKHYDLHPLLLEDVLNTGHRPKVEEFDNCIFLTLKMLGNSQDGESVVSEQISLVLGDGWVISFQEMEGDIFDALRNRIREGTGNIRKFGADYLFYRLIDTTVDNYFLVTDHLAELNEDLEESVLEDPKDEDLKSIQRIKKQLATLRRAVRPLREAIVSLQRAKSPRIRKATMRYFTDVYEHLIHATDSIDIQKDTISSIMDLYLSGVSNKMNKVMQVLTIIATIFIPLTFIAGVYGMNFQNMPETRYEYGYHVVMGGMFVIFILMLLYFRRKKWL